MAESASVRVRAELDSRPAEKTLARFVKKAESVDVRLSLKDKNFTQPLGRITGAADEFNKSLAASNARVVAFAASAGLMYSVQRALVSVTKSAIEVEAALADINVILGASSTNLAKFGDQLFKIAGQTGQAFQTVTVAATELARQGLSMEETLRRTKDAMILTRLAGMDAASAVDALTASINSFNKAAITSTEIVNKMATVDAAFAVSTNDLADALKRVGSSAIDAGVSFDQLMAMTTSVQQITARGGAVIGNSLKSIFTRIQRTEVLDQLQMLGVAVRDMKGNTLPAIQIMTQLAKTIDSLSSAQKANITELMGGVFQINVVKAALGDLGKEYSIYQNALKVSTDATDAATKRNEKLNETLSALVNKTFQNVKKAGAEIGKLTIAPALEGVLDKVNSALEKFDPKDSESTGNKIARGILEGIGNFIKGPGLIIGLAVIGKLLQQFGKFASDSFKEFFNINEAAKKRLAMEKFINQELSHNEDLTQAILSGELKVADAEKIILKGLEARVLQQEKLNRLIKEASYGLSRRGAHAALVDPTEGTYAVKPPKRSGGHVPNFSQIDIQALVKEELTSASYAKSGTKAVIDTLPGLGLHVRNTEESISYAPGMRSPFINPPIDSPEGRTHREKSIRQTGIDPYQLSSSSGLPGFAKANKKKPTPKIKDLRSSNKSKGVLLPEFGRNDTNLTFQSSLAQVFPDTKSLERQKWAEKGFTGFKMTGVKAARLREKSSASFDTLLDSNFDPAIQGLGSSIVGTNKGKLPKKTTGKFSDYFDKKAWPQTKGRIFEAALNYVAVNMSAKAQMNNRLAEIKNLTGGETWDFPDIKNQLASLYKIQPAGNWDAKSNIDQGTQASIIKKTLNTKYQGKTIPNKSAGSIPNFSLGQKVMGINTIQAKNAIERFRSGEISQAQGLVTQINSSRSLSSAEKSTLKEEINAIRRQKKNAKNPKGLTIDGTNLGSMLVPRVGSSQGTGLAKPKIDKDNTLLRQYLSKNYQAKTGLNFDKLPEEAKKKVISSTKASFPVLAPSRGNNVNIVDDVATAIEKETRSFVASMKGGSEAKKANVLNNLSTHQSSISSAAGAVFESGIKSAFDLEIGKTNDRFDVSTSAGLKEAFPIETPYGEFKIDDNSPLRQDMAAKILRQKIQMGIASGGHVPNFASPQSLTTPPPPYTREETERLIKLWTSGKANRFDPNDLWESMPRNRRGPEVDPITGLPVSLKSPTHSARLQRGYQGNPAFGFGLSPWSGGAVEPRVNPRTGLPYAGGFIPSFSKKDTNRMRESKQAGVPYSQTYLSFVDTSKYAGPVIGNRKDEPTYQALIKAVRSHPDPKNAGMAAGGYIPSFADAADAPAPLPIKKMNLDDLGSEPLKRVKTLESKLKGFVARLEKMNETTGGLSPEVNEAVEEAKGALSFVQKTGKKLGELGGKIQELEDELKPLETDLDEANLSIQGSNTHLEGLRGELEQFKAELGQTEDGVTLAREDLKASNNAISSLPNLEDGYKNLKTKEEEKLQELRAAEQAAGKQERKNLVNKRAVIQGDFDEEGMRHGQPDRVGYTKSVLGELGANAGQAGGRSSIKTLTEGVGASKTGQLDLKAQDALAITLQKQRNAAIMGQHDEAQKIEDEFRLTHKISEKHTHTQDALDKVFQKNLDAGTTIGNKAEEEAALWDKTTQAKKAEYETAKDKTKLAEGEYKEAKRLKGLRGKREKALDKATRAEEKAADQVTLTNRKISEGNQERDKQKRKQKDINNKIDKVNKELDDEVKAQAAKTKEVEEGVDKAKKVNDSTGKVEKGLQKEAEGRKNQSFGAGSYNPWSQQGKRYKSLKVAAGGDTDALAALGLTQGQAQGELAGAKEQRQQAIQGKAMLASMALPMVTSMAAQHFEEGTEEGARGKAGAEAIGQAGSMAAMGAMFGPWGAAAGAVVGATMGIIDVLGKWEDKTYEFNTAAETAEEKLTKFNNASQTYLKSLTEFNEVMTSTSGEIDGNKADKFRKNLSEALLSIPSEYRFQLSKAQGNVERIQEIFAEIQADLQRDANTRRAQADLATEIEERIPRGKGKMFKGKESDSDQKKVFEMIKSTLDMSRFYGEEGEKLGAKLRNASKKIASDFSGFKAVLKEAGADAKTLELLDDMLEGGASNITLLGDEFENFGSDAALASRAGDNLTSSILAYRRRMEAVKEEQDRWNSIMDESKERVKRLASVLLDRLKFIDNMRNQRAAHARGMAMTEIKGRQQVAQPFIDNIQKVDLGASVQRADMQNKQVNSLEKLNSSIKIGLIGTINDKFEKLTTSTERITENASEDQNLTNNELQKQNKTLTGYRDALIKAVTSASGGGDTFHEIAASMKEIIKKAEVTGSARAALESDLLAVVEKGNHDLALMSDAHKNELETQRLSAQYQKETAINTKQMAQLGTIGGMMAGPDFSKINKVFEDAALSSFRANSDQEGSRSSLNILDLLRNFAGTSGAALPASMRANAVEGVKSNLSTKVARIRSGMESTGQMTPELQEELDQLNNNLDEIAETKVAAQLKDVPTHLQTIADKISSLTDKTVNEASMEQAVAAALTSVMGGSSKHIVDPLVRIESILNFQRGINEIKQVQNNVADALKAQQQLAGNIETSMSEVGSMAIDLAKNVPDSILDATVGMNIKQIRGLIDNEGQGFTQDAEGLAKQKGALQKLMNVVIKLDGTITRGKVFDTDWGLNSPDLVAEREDAKIIGGNTSAISRTGQGSMLHKQIVDLKANQEKFESDTRSGKYDEAFNEGMNLTKISALKRHMYGAGPISDVIRITKEHLRMNKEFGFKGPGEGPRVDHQLIEKFINKLVTSSASLKGDEKLDFGAVWGLLREADQEWVNQKGPRYGMAFNQSDGGNLTNQKKVVNAALLALATYAENQKSGASIDHSGSWSDQSGRRKTVREEVRNQMNATMQGLQQRADDPLQTGRKHQVLPTFDQLTGEGGLLDKQLVKNQEVESAQAEMRRLMAQLTKRSTAEQVNMMRDRYAGEMRQREGKMGAIVTGLGIGPGAKDEVMDKLKKASSVEEVTKIIKDADGEVSDKQKVTLEQLEGEIQEHKAQKKVLEEITAIYNRKKATAAAAAAEEEEKLKVERKALEKEASGKIGQALELKTPEAKRAFNKEIRNMDWKKLSELNTYFDEQEAGVLHALYPGSKDLEEALSPTGGLLGEGSAAKRKTVKEMMAERTRQAAGRTANLFGDNIFSYDAELQKAGFKERYTNPMLPGQNNAFKNAKIDDPFQIRAGAEVTFMDDKGIIESIRDRYATIGVGAQEAKALTQDVAKKVIKGRLEAFKLFKNSDLSYSQYIVKLAGAELEMFRTDAASGKISQADLAGKLKAQVDKELGEGLNVDHLFAQYLHANMSMNKKDYDNLARTVAESMASGLMGHKGGGIHSAQLVQDKSKKIVDRVKGLELGKSQTTAYTNALGTFETFQMNFNLGLGGRAQMLAALNTKLQSALQNTRGTDGEIEKAYDEYIEALTTGLRPQDKIMERKGIMDSTGKKVGRDQIKTLDSKVESIVNKYEGQAAAGLITEEGRTTLQNAESILEATKLANEKDLVSTAAMTTARKNFLDALLKHGSDQTAVADAYRNYAASVAAKFKPQDLTGISAQVTGQFGQEMMGPDAGTFGATSQAITEKYNKAFGKGQISKAAVPRLAKAEGALKAAESKAKAGVLTAEQLTGAYLKFLNTLNSETNKLTEVQAAYEKYTASLGEKKGGKDLVTSRTKVLEATRKGATRGGQAGLVEEVESITKANQRLFNRGKLTGESLEALNKAESQYHNAQTNWANGLSSTAALMAAASKNLQAAVASGNTGKIKKALNEYISKLDTELKPQDYLEKAGKFIQKNQNKVGKGNREDFAKDLKKTSDKYEKLVDEGLLTEQDGQIISQALADFGAAQQNFKDGLISQSQLLKSAENQLSKISGTSGSAEIKKAMKDYMKASTEPIDALSTLQETGKDLGSLGGGILGKDLGKFKKQLQGINQSYNDSVNDGTLTRQNAKTLKKAAKDFALSEYEFGKEMRGSADHISAAKSLLEKHLKVGSKKTEQSLKKYLKAIDGATTPLDVKQFNIGQITKFAEQLTKAERRKFRRSLNGKDFKEIRASRERGEISRKEEKDISSKLGEIKKLEAEGAPLEEIRKAWDDYYKLRGRAYDSETEFIKGLANFYRLSGQGDIKEVMDTTRRGIVNQSRGDFSDLDEAQGFNQNLIDYQNELRTIAAERGATENDLKDALKAEAEYQKMIIDFNKGKIQSKDRIAGADAALKAKRAAGKDTADDFLDAMQARFSYGKREAIQAIQDTVLNMIDTFESELNDALFNAISGAKDAKEAFKDMADAMLDEITRMSIEATTRAVIGSLGIPGMARGGLVTGGSGVKDDVPRLLQGGEFVIKKDSVDKFGPGLFKALNEQNVAQFSEGGVASSLETPLQRSMRSKGIGIGMEKVEHVPDPQGGLSSISDTKGGGSGFTLRNAFVFDDDKRPTGGVLEVDSRLSRRALMDPDNPRNKVRMDKEKALVDYTEQRMQDWEDYQEAMQDYYDKRKNRWRMAGWNIAMQLGLNYMKGDRGGAKNKGEGRLHGAWDWVNDKINKKDNEPFPGGQQPQRRAQGGFIPFANGGLSSDKIPAMLTAGEYIMSRESVEKYGIDTMRKLNQGQVGGYAKGGLVNEGGPSSSGASGLSGSVAGTNNVNITVNVDSTGKADSQLSSQGSAASESEQSKNMARQIETAVVGVLLQQQKQGGMLRKTR